MTNDEIKQKGRKYYFTEYNPDWVRQYEELKKIMSPIWNKALAIKHIGSTSIQGMSAKPVIDVLVTIEKMEDFEKEVKQMTDLGFTCLKDYIAPNTLNFYQTGNEDDKINNIHVCELGSQRQRRFIIMRDYFRAHSDKAKEYSNLKQRNRDIHPHDYVSYREAKNDFLDEAEKQSYLWWFEQVLPQSWSRETCYEPQQKEWSSDNPSQGQCFVTTLLVNDYLGGEIKKAKSSSGVSHYWNRIDGEDIDFTRQQFPENEVFSDIHMVQRENIEENSRYNILKQKIQDKLK